MIPPQALRAPDHGRPYDWPYTEDAPQPELPSLTADQQIRAAALHAAVLRHRDVASWEPDGTDVMLRTAERFETWIRDGEDE